MFRQRILFRILALGLMLWGHAEAATTLRVGSYNLENYVDVPTTTRVLKNPTAKAKVLESLLALDADVLALQEVGTTNALLELRDSLKSAGVSYSHWEHVQGYDTNVHVAVLSKLPIISRRPHTNESFLLNGKRFLVSRGFADVDIQVSPVHTVTVLTAHLKSKRQIGQADQAEIREQEAQVLRQILDARFAHEPNCKLILAGDLNDTKDALPIRAILGRGRTALTDTRPSERNEDGARLPHERRLTSRSITWTHFYAKEDTYSRIDYLLLSHALVKSWLPDQSYVLNLPDWGIASDHRPILVELKLE